MSANPGTPEPTHIVALQESAPQPSGAKRPPMSKARFFWVLRTLGWRLLLGLGLGLMLQQTVTAGQKATDFCQDYLAARNVLQGMPPYSPLLTSPNAHLCLPPLNYDSHPPFSELLVLPLGLLPRAAASLLWLLLVLACYFATGALLLKALGWWTVRGAALFVVGSLFWTPFGGSLDAQNYSEILMLLVLGSWLLERKGHTGWAGVALGLAALLKIWPLLLF
jgi:hypothetical protein